MIKSALMGISLAFVSTSLWAAPLAGCYQAGGAWSELLQGGQDGAAGNTITATDGATYSFTATLVDAEPSDDSAFDWVTLYNNGKLILINATGAPWFNPEDPVDSTTEIPLSEVWVKTKKLENNQLQFVLFSQEGWFSIAASSVDPVTLTPEGSDVLVTGELEEAEVCINAGKFNIVQQSLNVKSRGVLPVVLYGGEAFDVRDVNISKLMLNGAPALRGVVADVNEDGSGDLVLKFATQDVVESLMDTPDKTMVSLVLTGELKDDGLAFSGSDDVRIINKGKPAKPQKPTKPNPGKGKGKGKK